MQFTSFDFFVFFPSVVLLFYVLPRRFRQLWLLLASYYFYMGWNTNYIFLILASTIITYLCAMLIEHTDVQDKRKRKVMLTAGIAANLTILIYFKYFYFLYDMFATFISVLNMEMKPLKLDIVLPVGISFYIFQTLGYMIDVYRGTVKAEKNIIRYALFVSFFPQLVAGPIERSSHLLGQIEKLSSEKSWNSDKVVSGLLLMLWGYFMKIVIADRAAVLVNRVFGIYYMFSGVALMIAAIMFAIQIYCDFASYSVIAMGAAKVLGIDLVTNFEAPFFSCSIRELWSRWHVSLSSWFRDYLYIPLGGNRCSKPRMYFNHMLTFAVSGFWHGASWHYVVWGMIQGIYIVIGDLLKPVKTRLQTFFHVRVKTFGYQFFRRVCTFLLFVLALVFFRASTVKDAVYYIQRMFMTFDVWSLFDGAVFNLGLDQQEMCILLIGILILMIVDAYYARKKLLFDAMVKGQCFAVQYMMVALLLVMIIVFGMYGEGYDAVQFIYFQF